MLDVTDFNDFDVFAEVSAAGSLRAAARRLGITRPLASRRLTRLERELGTALVVRSTSGIELTPAGRRLLPYLRGVSRLMNEAFATMRESTPAGAFRVHCDATLAPTAIPFVTQALAGLPLSIVTRAGDRHDAARAVVRGEADVAFTPRTSTGDDVVAEPFLLDRLAFVVAPDDPLTTATTVEVGDLIDRPVAVDRSTAGGEAVADHLIVAGLPLDLLHHVEPADTATALAARCGHVGVILASSARIAVADGLVVELDVQGVPPWRFEIDMLTRLTDAALEPVQRLRSRAADHRARADVPA